MKRLVIVAMSVALSQCAYAGWDMATPSYSTSQDRDGNLVARSYTVGGVTYVSDPNGNVIGSVQQTTRTVATAFDGNGNYIGQVSRSSHEIPPIPSIPPIPAIPR